MVYIYETSRLDRKSVAFGEVIHGLEVLRYIETFGTSTGVP